MHVDGPAGGELALGSASLIYGRRAGDAGVNDPVQAALVGCNPWGRLKRMDPGGRDGRVHC